MEDFGKLKAVKILYSGFSKAKIFESAKISNLSFRKAKIFK